ncbi:MAG: hypothetical protein ACPIOQ_56480 [Promethearchaeia archaeon]
MSGLTRRDGDLFLDSTADNDREAGDCVGQLGDVCRSFSGVAELYDVPACKQGCGD